MRWNEERQVSIYGDSLYYASTGTAGTTYPIGTKDYPCSSLANLKTMAAATGIKNIILLTDITLDATVTSGLTLIGQDSVKVVALASQVIDGVSFVGVSITGIQGAAAAGVYCYKCSINATIDTLIANQCSVNAITVVAGGALILSDCSAETATSTITCSGTGAVTVSDFSGNLVLAASLAGDVITLTGMNGSISIGAGCTAGTITIYGDVKVTDASAGATVVDYSTHTHLGEMSETATADDLTDISTTSAMAKLRRVLLRFSSGAFTSTVNGTARTDVENMITGLASYVTAAGAAYSKKVNNQTLRTNIEQILQDYFAVVGCDDANSYSVTAQGASQTTQKAALYALAQYMAASGAAIAATVNPGGTSKNNIEEILEDLGIMLAGGAGIVTWPGSVKWGNGVSFAEALAFASDEAETIHTEVETTSVALGGGSAATLTRSGLLQRYIADNITGLVASGLAYEAVVTTYTGVTDYKASGLLGKGNSYFKNWSTYVLWDKAGAGAAPQNEMQANSAYVSADGSFTHIAFTAPLEVGDYVLILHPSIAAVINATYGLSALQVLIGAMDAAATNDTLADITTTSMMAKLRRTLLRFSPGAYTTPINGTARTDVLACFTGLASYLSASGAALSIQVNGGAVNADYEAVWEAYLAVIGCNGANVFNPTIQGAGQTNLDAALYALAQYFATTGAAMSATVNPGGTARATLELILEDFSDMLAGGTGIITWPGSVKYGNGVSMAEALAYVSDTADAISSGVSEGTLDIIEDVGGSSTVITASEITQGVNFWKGALLLSTSGNNDGQARPIVASAVGSVTVFPAFDGAVIATDTFKVISTWRPDVWNQQADVAVNITAIVAGATVLDLSTAGYSYMLNHLRLKCVDPGADTVTIGLYEVINGSAETLVDTFVIDTSNYTTYHSLMDMFGVPHVAGDDILIKATASANSYAITGQYQYALARTA